MKAIEPLANYLKGKKNLYYFVIFCYVLNVCIKGPQRFPKNDENYVKTCLAALFS